MSKLISLLHLAPILLASTAWANTSPQAAPAPAAPAATPAKKQESPAPSAQKPSATTPPAGQKPGLSPATPSPKGTTPVPQKSPAQSPATQKTPAQSPATQKTPAQPAPTGAQASPGVAPKSSVASKAEEFVFDTVHSRVGFEVKHMTVTKVPGYFKNFEGTFTFNPANIMETVVTAKAQAKSVSTDNEKRDEHLRSPHFFDVEKFPELSLKSRKVTKKSNNSFILTTDLKIKGVTKEVPFEVIYNGMAGGKVGFEASAVINRQDFGLNFTKIVDSLPVVGDQVRIIIHAQGMRKNADEAPKK